MGKERRTSEHEPSAGAAAGEGHQETGAAPDPFAAALASGNVAQLAAAVLAAGDFAQPALFEQIQVRYGNATANAVIDATRNPFAAVAGASTTATPQDFGAHAKAHASKPIAHASERATALASSGRAALADVGLVLSAWLPGFAAARDQLEPEAVARIGADICGKLRVAVDVQEALGETVQPGAEAVHSATPEQGADIGLLTPLWSTIGGELALGFAQAAEEVGPHRFGGKSVMPGAAASFPRNHVAALERLTHEARNTAELVALAAAIRDEWVASSGQLAPEAEGRLARQLSNLATRPVHFAFVKAALGSLGIWSYLEQLKTPRAQHEATTLGDAMEKSLQPGVATLADVDHDVARQAKQFGAMVDLKGFDQAGAINLLESDTWITYLDDAKSLPSRATSTPDARRVLDMMRELDPSARAAVLEHFRRANVLDLFAGGLPWALVQKLDRNLPPGFGAVSRELAPYYEHRNTADYSVGNIIDHIPVVGGALEEVANGLTFGFLHEHDRSYRAERRGEISGSEQADATFHAAERAAAVMVVSTVTGGAAGTYMQGATRTLAATGTAGRIAASTVTGMVAGGSAAVGGQLGSDAVEGELSSFDQYLDVAAHGAAFGGAVGGGAATLGAVGGRFIPQALQARFQRLAERFPDLAPQSEIAQAIEALGERHSMGVAMFVTDAAELIEAAKAGVVRVSAEQLARLKEMTSIDTSGFGPQPAAVGAYGGGANTYQMSTRPRVRVQAIPAQDLHSPGVLEQGPALAVTSVEEADVIRAGVVADEFASRQRGGHDAVLDDLVDNEGVSLRNEDDALGPRRKDRAMAEPKGPEELPPSGEHFDAWFDALTPEELGKHLKNAAFKKVISDRLRGDGGQHEWLMVAEAKRIKEWGVPIGTVKSAVTRTDAVIGRIEKGGETVTFRHGGEGSNGGTFHRQLRGMITSSSDLGEFMTKLNHWADKSLAPVSSQRWPEAAPLGRYSLPGDLQLRGEGGIQ